MLQIGSASKRTPLARWPAVLLLGSVVGAICGGCASPEAVEAARARVRGSRRNEGRASGEAAGFVTGFDAAFKEAYKKTVHHSYVSGEYRRDADLVLGSITGFFLLGFLFQWFILYIPRRLGILLDIDLIVLPREMTRVELSSLPDLPNAEQTRRSKSSGGPFFLLLLVLLPIIGCKGAEREAWEAGYDTNHTTAYDEGLRIGATRGQPEGQQKGQAAGRDAARTGRVWDFYAEAAYLSLIIGVTGGLATQYTILICCQAGISAGSVGRRVCSSDEALARLSSF